MYYEDFATTAKKSDLTNGNIKEEDNLSLHEMSDILTINGNIKREEVLNWHGIR